MARRRTSGSPLCTLDRSCFVPPGLRFRCENDLKEVKRSAGALCCAPGGDDDLARRLSAPSLSSHGADVLRPAGGVLRQRHSATLTWPRCGPVPCASAVSALCTAYPTL